MKIYADKEPCINSTHIQKVNNGICIIIHMQVILAHLDAVCMVKFKQNYIRHAEISIIWLLLNTSSALLCTDATCIIREAGECILLYLPLNILILLKSTLKNIVPKIKH